MALSPLYTFEQTLLSNDNRIASRISTEIDVTAADVGKWVFAVIGQADITDPKKRGHLAKERQVAGTWVEIGGAAFDGGPDHWDDVNNARIFTGVGIDLDDVGKSVRFTWQQDQQFTSRLEKGTMTDRE